MAAESIVKFTKPTAPVAPVKAPAPTPTQQTSIGTNMAGTTVNSGANKGYVLQGASSGTTPATVNQAAPKTTPILANPSSGTPSTTTPATAPAAPLAVPAPPVSSLEQHVTNTADTAQAQADAETQRQLQANYYDQYIKPWEAGNAQGLPVGERPPATYQEYAQKQAGKTQQNIDYTAGQNKVQSQIDQLGLARTAAQGAAAMANTTNTMAQGREDVMGSSKPLVAQQFSKEQQAVIDEANLRVQAAQDQRDQAIVLLENAKQSGQTDLATQYQAAVDSANQQILKNKQDAAKVVTDANNTALDQAKTLSASGALNTATPDQLQAYSTQFGIPLAVLQTVAQAAAQTSMTTEQKNQADLISSFTANAINLNSSGATITDQMVQDYSQKTGVPAPYIKDVANSLNQTVQAIVSSKNLTPEIQKQALDTAKQNAADALSGFNTTLGQQSRFLETIQKMVNTGQIDPGLGQTLMTQGLVAMGKPDYADPITTAKLQYSQLQTQALQLQNQVDSGAAPYGSPAWVALQKTKLDMQALIANTYENTGKDISGTSTEGVNGVWTPGAGNARTDRNNNPIAVAVALDNKGNPAMDSIHKEWFNALDAAGAQYTIEKGSNFSGNMATIKFNTPEDGIKGAVALLKTSAFSWYKKTTGKEALAGINSPAQFAGLSPTDQIKAVEGIYSHEGGGGKFSTSSLTDNGPVVSPLGYTNPSEVPFKSAATTYQLPDSTQLGQPLTGQNVGMPPSGKTYQDYINEAQAQGVIAPKDQKAYAMKQLDAQNALQTKTGSVPNPTGAKRSVSDIIYVSPNSGQQFSLSSWMNKSPSGYDYVDLNQAGEAKAMAKDTATQNGIASLEKDQVAALTNIDTTQQALDQLKTTIIPHLSDNNGAWNPITGTWANVQNSYAAATNTDPDLKQYMDQQRIELMNTMRGIFTGMKINPSRLASVETALPNFTDNKASAEEKITRLQELLSNTERDLIKSNGGKLTK